MTWVIFAIFTAIFESLKDITSKQSLKKVDEYIVSWSVMAFSLPLLLPILFFIHIPILNFQFGLALLVGGSLNLVSLLMYIKAIKLSDLSLTVPLITFTPLFLLVTSPLIVNEYPTVTDAIGILFIVTGSYFLNLKEKQKGYLAPFKALMEQKGPKLMLGVAFIWSITANIDKIGVENSSPTFWGISLFTFLAVSLLPIALYKSYPHFKTLPQYLPELIPMGLFNGATILFQMQALSLTLVSHVISVKRTSAMITVFLGYLIFKEQGIKERSIGAGIMILGVILITVAN